VPKVVRRLVLALVAIAVALGAVAYGWLDRPLALRSGPVDLAITPGTSARAVAEQAVAAGVEAQPLLLYAWFRLSGDARRIQAGSYEIEAGSTPRTLLRKLVRGEQALRSVTLVEGWNFRQVREALARASDLKQEGAGLDDAALMQRLGQPAGSVPEGRFFPDTYSYPKGSTDLQLLARALKAMDTQLAAAWAMRAPDTPLKTPQEALTLASIVEKETGRPEDRPLVAAVFSNRLRIGMLLQTDPTVIYGLGPGFDGNLRKKDLQTDTPWNTYTRAGLPPTPIAMPGRDALLAAVAPPKTADLYFVARGDGSSHFSPSLEQHNRAVDKYQRGR
jgi:UPF0755 protein